MKHLPKQKAGWYNSNVEGFEVAPLGDSALLLRLTGRSEEGADDSVGSLLKAQARIEMAAIPGVLEVVLGYASVAVFFDPIGAGRAGAPLDHVSDWLTKRLQTALSAAELRRELLRPPAVVEIPVCYDSEFAIDLGRVASHAALEPADVIRRHGLSNYRVRCVGFTPGFPYLAGLPPELATPRHASPRKDVPAGAVAIGGNQAGIYPTPSPGGWNVIGRTPLPLFDPHRDSPALLRVGDEVRFHPINREEFEKRAVAAVYDRRNGATHGANRQS